MPSGSHRGSRGSHSSGGSRSGGFSRGSRGSRSGGFSVGSRGSHFGGGHRHHGGGIHIHAHRPLRIRFGRRYYVYSTGVQSRFAIFGILFVFALIFTFAMNLRRQDAQYDINLIEQDYYYYQDMIRYAESHDMVVEGVVVDKFYNPEADRYYVIYEIETGNGQKLEGYTYSCYTETEVGKYRRGGSIDIAVDQMPITSSTDSINMDYKDMPLTKDGEYLLVQAELREATISFVICVIVDIAIVVGFVIYAYKKKEVEEDKGATPTQTEKVEEDVYCNYCGSLLSKDAKKCSSCGAAVRK